MGKGLERYLRQSAIVDQEKLASGRVLVAGVGGLGCFVALELVTAGVGTVHVVDKDVVEIHNLNRQFLYRESDVGEYKAGVAEIRLREINEDVEVRGFVARWDEMDVNGYDIVFDCLDAWGEKDALAGSRKGIMVAGSVGEDSGFVAVPVERRIPAKKVREACSNCILGARVGTIASIMAGEGIMELSGRKSPLRDRMLHVDFRGMGFTTLEL